MSLLLFYVLCGAPLCGVLFLLAYFAVFSVRFVGRGLAPFLRLEVREVARADMESAPTANHKFCNNARCFGGVKTPPYGANLQRDVGANSVRPGSRAFTQGCTGRRGRRPLRVTQKFESARGGPMTSIGPYRVRVEGFWPRRGQTVGRRKSVKKNAALLHFLAFSSNDHLFGVLRGEQPLSRASRAIGSSGHLFGSFWVSKRNKPTVV